MNYHNITTDDMLNGDGLRTVLWVSGCNHHCKNCQNPQTWDKESGVPFSEGEWKELLSNLGKPYISGITYSGGDPLLPENRETIRDIAKAIRQLYPAKTQWLYTGYKFEEIKDLETMKYLDVVVDGEYIDSQRDVTLPWRGSKNQRVIDVQKSLAENCVKLHCDSL